MRDADLPPTPGRRDSSLMRFASGGAVNLEQSRNLHPAGHGADAAGHLFVDFARGFVHGGDDEVLQHFDVVRINGFLVDGDGEQFFRARIADEIFGLVRVFGEIKQLGPVVVAGVLDDFGGVAADGEDRGDVVVLFVEILVEERLAPAVFLPLRQQAEL